jgi:hypothetical protein
MLFTIHDWVDTLETANDNVDSQTTYLYRPQYSLNLLKEALIGMIARISAAVCKLLVFSSIAESQYPTTIDAELWRLRAELVKTRARQFQWTDAMTIEEYGEWFRSKTIRDGVQLRRMIVASALLARRAGGAADLLAIEVAVAQGDIER